MTEVPYVDFPRQYEDQREQILAIVDDVFSKGSFVGGREVELLEDDLCAYTGSVAAVAVNSGTDALILSLRAAGIGPGAEVITQPNSFIASTGAIVAVGATPVFVDVMADQNISPDLIEAAITAKTRAIMPVHLTGRMADMPRIMAIARLHGLIVIEDAAQAMGSRRDGSMAGTIGHFGCLSAHPLKNLNAAGDAGFILTDDRAAAEQLRLIRSHGLAGRDLVREFGVVSRLDVLQAAIIRFRLRHLDHVIERRRRNVALYRAHLDPESVFWPPCRKEEFNTFHTFVIQAARRDDLKRHLADGGIGSAVHYPTPIHLQPAAAEFGYAMGDFPVAEEQAGRILSLPVHQYLNEQQIIHVAETVNAFYREAGP